MVLRAVIEWLAAALKGDEIGSQLGEALEKVSQNYHHDDSGLRSSSNISIAILKSLIKIILRWNQDIRASRN